MQKYKFNFLTPVWGSTYVDNFLEFVVPTLLAKNNLTAFEKIDAIFSIFTLNADRKKFEESPSFSKLAAVVKINFFEMDSILAIESNSIALHLSYQLGIDREEREYTEVNFVFLNADVLFSNSAIDVLIKYADENKRCVLESVFRACEETLLPEIRGFIGFNGEISLTNRDLVRIGLAHLHPGNRTSMWDRSGVANRLVNKFYWDVPGEGMLSKNFLLHPLMIRLSERLKYINGFVDYSLIPLTFPDSNSWHIITQSDEFFRLEFAPYSHEIYNIENHPYTEKFAAKVLNCWATKEHRQFSKISIYYNFLDRSSAWNDVEGRANEVMENIHSHFNLPAQPSIGHHYWKGPVNFSQGIVYKSKKSFARKKLAKLRESMFNFSKSFNYSIYLRTRKILLETFNLNAPIFYVNGKNYTQGIRVEDVIKGDHEIFNAEFKFRDYSMVIDNSMDFNLLLTSSDIDTLKKFLLNVGQLDSNIVIAVIDFVDESQATLNFLKNEIKNHKDIYISFISTPAMSNLIDDICSKITFRIKYARYSFPVILLLYPLILLLVGALNLISGLFQFARKIVKV